LKLDQEERDQIARRRLVSILTRHGVALARTLEQKISDAGPEGQRIDPHVLTRVRGEMVDQGRIVQSLHVNAPWFHLVETSQAVVQRRLEEQLPVYQELNRRSLTLRLGQALEIATYKALLQSNLEFHGRFKDLADHDDSKLYAKEEPPQHIGRLALAGDQRLDFLVRHPEAKHLGVECKNVREWLYPDREEIAAALAKCITLDCVPVLIARRIPYVSFQLFTTCGVILHQNYNQLFAVADTPIADKARDKRLLGYHDIRIGNEPNERLIKFITTNLPKVAPAARAKFDSYKDLLSSFAFRMSSYDEFAARVRRRSQGENEDFDRF
jgi:hypothetical protein